MLMMVHDNDLKNCLVNGCQMMVSRCIADAISNKHVSGNVSQMAKRATKVKHVKSNIFVNLKSDQIESSHQ